MAGTNYTEAQLRALEAAYASGTLSLTYEGKNIRYRSLDEMERALNTVRREVLRAQGKRQSRRVHLTSNRGL